MRNEPRCWLLTVSCPLPWQLQMLRAWSMPKLNLLCNQNRGLIWTVFGLLFRCSLGALGSPLLVLYTFSHERCTRICPADGGHGGDALLPRGAGAPTACLWGGDCVLACGGWSLRRNQALCERLGKSWIDIPGRGAGGRAAGRARVPAVACAPATAAPGLGRCFPLPKRAHLHLVST